MDVKSFRFLSFMHWMGRTRKTMYSGWSLHRREGRRWPSSSWTLSAKAVTILLVVLLLLPVYTVPTCSLLLRVICENAARNIEENAGGLVMIEARFLRIVVVPVT